MKRSNHKTKKNDHTQRIVATCAYCGHEARSKYEAKQHICRGVNDHA